MHATGGGAADEQRQGEIFPLHLAGHMAHLIQARRDEAGDADDVGALGAGSLEYAIGGHHDTEIDDLVVVAGKDYADDILANVVHVTFGGGKHHLAGGAGFVVGGFFSLHVWFQMGNRLFHYPRAFHHLGQEHLAGAEQVADHIHAVHERAFDDLKGALCECACFFGVGDYEVVDTVHQRIHQAAVGVGFAPTQILRLLLCLALHRRCNLEQSLRRIVASVEKHIFDALAQAYGDILVDGQLAGIDDGHVQPRLDGVVEKGGVHGLAQRVVASEGKRQIGNAA